ncbi:MAG: hypothetical protein EBT12_00240 [Marivivens sp.]|nr:hypothetical protein [Marivivens sp.]
MVLDDNTTNANSGSVGAGFTADYAINDTYFQVISGYINSVPDASEDYDLIFDDSGRGGGSHDGFVTYGFVVDDTVIDNTPPVFNAGPTAANATDVGHDIQATLDEDGTIYAVRLADGAAAPSSAQVKAGQDAASSPAPEAKSVAATASVQASMTFSTGSELTAYDYYVVAEDDEGTPNIQASPTLVNATTLEAQLVIDSISPANPKPGDTVTINVSNANNASGKTVTYNGSSIAVSSQDINSLTINSWPYPWDLATPDVDFNTNYDVQVTDGGESDTIVAQTQPATGEDYFVITGKPWPDTSIYFDDPAALDNGDKHWGYWSTGGTGATVATNGVVSNVQDGYVYTYRLLDLTSGLWGAAATETFNIGEPAAVSLAITLVDSAENPLLSITGINWAWYDSVDAQNLGAVVDSGVNENTNGAGLLEIDLPNTTLIAGQQGTLLVKDATGRTGFYNVTVQ